MPRSTGVILVQAGRPVQAVEGSRQSSEQSKYARAEAVRTALGRTRFAEPSVQMVTPNPK